MRAGASTLGSDEVDKMVAEAEKFSEEDKQKREEIDVRNSVCIVACLPHACLLTCCRCLVPTQATTCASAMSRLHLANNLCGQSR